VPRRGSTPHARRAFRRPRDPAPDAGRPGSTPRPPKVDAREIGRVEREAAELVVLRASEGRGATPCEGMRASPHARGPWRGVGQVSRAASFTASFHKWEEPSRPMAYLWPDASIS